MKIEIVSYPVSILDVYPIIYLSHNAIHLGNLTNATETTILQLIEINYFMFKIIEW